MRLKDLLFTLTVVSIVGGFVQTAPALAQSSIPVAITTPIVSDIQDISAIDRVWSGHSVKSALLITKTHIVVAYYDASRQLTVAQRPIHNGAHWVYQKLDTWNGWDSHNYIAMGLDRSGRLHIAGNMHSDPLTYFQSDVTSDIRTLKRIGRLVDTRTERSMTYPIFLHDQAGGLLFKYRDGASGNGNEIYDAFEEKTGTWAHLTLAPLVDGEGLRNAYFMGPVLGPDHLFHIAWVWRDTPMAETNHDLSYAKSADLIHWVKADGSPLPLPIRFSKAEIVDPVPVKGGMINNNTLIGFDDLGRVTITYHKYDAQGHTQIFVARREADIWHIAQISHWTNYRWDFGGGGSLNSELFVDGVRSISNGELLVPVVRLGKSIQFIVRASDLSLVEERTIPSLADQLNSQIAVPEGMQLNVIEQVNDGPHKDGDISYAIAWPTRPPHRDLPSTDIPDPTTLRLITLHWHKEGKQP